MAAQEVAQSVPEPFRGDGPLLPHIPTLRANIKAQRPHWPKQGAIYFVGTCDGLFVKIGFSAHLTARVCDIQSGMPYPIELLAWTPGSMAEEWEYHRQFDAHRHFCEWFRRVPEIDAEIERLNAN